MSPGASGRRWDLLALTGALAVVLLAHLVAGVLRGSSPTVGGAVVVVAAAAVTFGVVRLAGASAVAAAATATVALGCPLALVAGQWVGAGTLGALGAAMGASVVAAVPAVRSVTGRRRTAACLVLGVLAVGVPSLLVPVTGGWGSGGGADARGTHALLSWFALDPVLPVVTGASALVLLAVAGRRLLGLATLAVGALTAAADLRVAVLVAALPLAAWTVVEAVTVAGAVAGRRSGRVASRRVAAAVAGTAATLVLVVASVGAVRDVPSAAPSTPDAAAARWVVAQVPGGEPVAVDPASRRQLALAGQSVGKLVALRGGVTAPAPGVRWLIAGPAVRAAPRGTWAARALEVSRSVASFGSGPRRVQVRSVHTSRSGTPIPAPAPSPTPSPSPTGSTASTPAPAEANQELAENPNVTLSEAARSVLSTQSVDARLLALLAQLASSTTVSVTDLPVTGTDPPSVPRRTAVIDELGGVAVARAPDAVASLRITLAAQAPNFRPDVTLTGAGDTQQLVLTLPT